jgi:hypothetical protein
MAEIDKNVPGSPSSEAPSVVPTSAPVPLQLRPVASSFSLAGEIKEEGVFASLVSSFRDTFFPSPSP